jgi:hypothetical protein
MYIENCKGQGAKNKKQGARSKEQRAGNFSLGSLLYLCLNASTGYFVASCQLYLHSYTPKSPEGDFKELHSYLFFQRIFLISINLR